MSPDTPPDSQAWLDAHPEIAALRLAAVDLNGIARGKRIPAAHAPKAFAGGLRMPLSALNVDIRGADIADSPLVFASGDADGRLLPTGRGPVPMPWFDTPSALLPLWMFEDGGAPFAGDPRHALHAVLERFAAHGLTPVVATEMEFYLLDPEADLPAPPKAPGSGRRLASMDVLSLAALDEHDRFFTDLYAACAEMGIPADAAISEGGVGQFEINLLHRDDALAAADDAWLFRLAARGVARRHGMLASFIAKPYADQPGSGLHVHFSLRDESGRNVFDDGSESGSETLKRAVAGVLAAMPGSTLIFAPHAGSHARLSPHSHAPTRAAWGYENRTLALRIPGGPAAARRIEHRVAGADANPYLVLAAVLGAALNGIEDARTPPPPVAGDGYDAAGNAPPLPGSWQQAQAQFAEDPLVGRIFAPLLIDNLCRCKRQESAHMEEMDDARRIRLYLQAL